MIFAELLLNLSHGNIKLNGAVVIENGNISESEESEEYVEEVVKLSNKEQREEERKFRNTL